MPKDEKFIVLTEREYIEYCESSKFLIRLDDRSNIDNPFKPSVPKTNNEKKPINNPTQASFLLNTTQYLKSPLFRLHMWHLFLVMLAIAAVLTLVALTVNPVILPAMIAPIVLGLSMAAFNGIFAAAVSVATASTILLAQSFFNKSKPVEPIDNNQLEPTN